MVIFRAGHSSLPKQDQKPSTRLGTKSTPAMYTLEEVIVLVDDYTEFAEMKHKGWIHVRLIDIDRGVRTLPPLERLCVLLIGKFGLSQREVAELLDMPHQKINRRYHRGIHRIYTFLNGG
jgi:DNA-directed RNA polymerase specialized sigma24 family protein